MATGLNKVLLIGNTAAEPDFRILNSNNGSNTAIATVGLATNEAHKDASGNTTEQTEWHRLVFWGRQAEIVRDFCRKGSQIFVEGKIKTRTYEDQQGIKRYSTEIHVQELKLLGSKSSSASAPAQGEWGQPQTSQQWSGGQQAAPQQWGQAPGWTQQAPAQAAPQQWGQQPAAPAPQQQYQGGYQQAAPAYQQRQGGNQQPPRSYQGAAPAGAVPVDPVPAQAPQQPQAAAQATPAAFQAQAPAQAPADNGRPFKDDDLPF